MVETYIEVKEFFGIVERRRKLKDDVNEILPGVTPLD